MERSNREGKGEATVWMPDLAADKLHCGRREGIVLGTVSQRGTYLTWFTMCLHSACKEASDHTGIFYSRLTFGNFSSATNTPPSKGVPSGPCISASHVKMSSSVTGPAMMPSGGSVVRARNSEKSRREASAVAILQRRQAVRWRCSVGRENSR